MSYRHICGNYKNNTDEPICKAEIETQMQRKKAWTPRRGGRGIGKNWEIGAGMDILLCKWITNEKLLYRELYLMYFGDCNRKEAQERGDACPHS